MPARTKKSEAASKRWAEKKGPALSSNQWILSSKRPRKLKSWSNESMLLAIKAVRDGMGTNTMAARSFSVPPSTLKDLISGGTNSGPVPYLDESEEKELVDFLVKSAAMGHGKTKQLYWKEF